VLIDDIFAELAEAEIIERRPGLDLGGEPAWGFRHALLRDAAYASLSDDDRPIAHRLTATWLERRRVDEPARLAEHWRKSDRPELAAPWYQRAAERAIEGCDYQGALRFVAEGLALGASGEIQGHLLLAAAEAHEWLANSTEREGCAERAQALFPPGSPPWFRALFHLLAAKARVHGREGIDDFASMLRALPRSEAPSEDEVIALARVAELFFRSGDRDRGAEIQRMAREGADRLERMSPKVEGFLAWVAAWEALNGGDVQGAYERDAEAAEAFERAGEARLSCHARANVGYEQMRLGLLDDAIESYESALETAERLGMRLIVGNTAHNLGLIYGLVGRVDEGIAMEKRALAELQTIEAPRGVAASHDYLARLYLMAGRGEEAVESARRAVAAAARWPDLVLAECATLGRALAAVGQLSEALEQTQKAMAICGNQRSTDGEDLYVAAARLEVLEAAGKDEERAALATWAQGELERQAKALGSLREVFVTRVPEHALIARQRTV
jgi:tetratricopeptide (TPR) repeat protein